MDSISEIKLSESEYLEKIRSANPDFFSVPTIVEDDNMLRRFGIKIPGKERFAGGMIKLFASDFIVEEVCDDSHVCTISSKEDGGFQSTPDGKIIQATLVKCNISTLEAVDELCRLLHCQKTDIGYAGIKDKEAITAQRISIRNVPLEKVRETRSSHFFLKDITTSDKLIQKGLIKGNRFTIYVRTSPEFFHSEHSTLFISSLKQIKESGFFNFYYLQRFGMPRLINFDCGLQLIKGNYEGALKMTACQAGEYEIPFMRNIREELSKTWGDWDKSLALIKDLPVLFRDEHIIYSFLKRKPGHWQGAWQQLLDKLSIVVYSVPSLLFNELISIYLESKMEIPPELPLIFSPDRSDAELYKPFLKSLGIYPLPIQNLRSFPIIKIMKRTVATKDIPKIYDTSLTENGLVITFELSKGQYATTLLAHLFNLVSGTPPEYINQDRVDIKESLGIKDCAETLKYFDAVINAKKER